MAQNDYQTFGDSGVDGVNKLSLANYKADNDRVYGNGYTTKVIRSQLHNKALQQTSKMSAALAQFLVNNGQDALDTDSFSTLATKLGTAVLPTAAISNFRAYQSTGQSISANTNTAIIFQTKVFDDLVEYDVATGKFTAKVAGTYVFTCGIYGGQTSATTRLSIIYVNGVAKCRLQESAADNGNHTIAGTSIPLKLNAGDYVQVYYSTGTAETTGNGITDLTLLEQIIYFGGYRIK